MADLEQVGSGVVTAPAANAVIASIAAGSLPAGKYDVTVIGTVSNAAVADLNNMKLQRGGVDWVNPIPIGASGDVGTALELEQEELSGSQALEVKAIGAGTAAIEYSATITAKRVG